MHSVRPVLMGLGALVGKVTSSGQQQISFHCPGRSPPSGGAVQFGTDRERPCGLLAFHPQRRMESLILWGVLLPLALIVLLVLVTVRLGRVSRDLRRTGTRIEALLARLDGPEEGPSGEVPSHGPVAPPEPEPHMEPPVDAPITLEQVHEAFPDGPPDSTAGPITESSVRPGPTPSPPPLRPPGRPGFFERNPDLEKFIGENLINKIGIAVLVLGIGFMLKYAIGKGYIGEVGRTLVGLLSGGLLVGLAHRLHERFRGFSSVLMAGGIVVFYFTITIAYRDHQLLGQTAAFLAMVAITGLAVAFTLGYDRRELAVIALLGGFASPFLASSGAGNYQVLFSYLLILDVGMLVLANYKKWPVINILSFLLSWLIFGAWALFGAYEALSPAPWGWAMVFAASFFAVFCAMVLLYDLRHRTPFGPLDYSLYLTNTAAFFGLGLFFLSDAPLHVDGLFALAIGAVNLALALRFFRESRAPRHLVYLLIGLVLTFLSLAAPVQLEGSRITLFWAAEAVLLLWFGQRTGIKLVARGSVLVAIAMLIGLLSDLVGIYASDTLELRPLVNAGWTTGMVVGLSLLLYVRLLRRDEAGAPILGPLQRFVVAVAEVGLVVVLFTTNYLEIQAQVAKALSYYGVQVALSAYTLAFLLVLDLLTRNRGRTVRSIVAALMAVRLLAQASVYYQASRGLVSEYLLYDTVNPFPLLHAITVILTLLVIIRVARSARLLMPRGTKAWRSYLWCMCTLLVVLASQELDHLLILLGRHEGHSIRHVLEHSRKWGYPILWGVGSFLFMLYGMRFSLRPVRIIALTLFGITLVKLFTHDIVGASEEGKVAAFISLGVLLLVIGFLYQKLKGLVITPSEHIEDTKDVAT